MRLILKILVIIYYNQNPLIYVTTPVMVCLFGLDKKTKQMSDNLQI